MGNAANGVYDRVNAKDDNLYLWGDVSSGIPNTGLTVKAHVGYSNGNKGLGPFATSVSPTGEYFWGWHKICAFYFQGLTFELISSLLRCATQLADIAQRLETARCQMPRKSRPLV